MIHLINSKTLKQTVDYFETIGQIITELKNDLINYINYIEEDGFTIDNNGKTIERIGR